MSLKNIIFFFLFLSTYLCASTKAIIWGYELNTHTHSYIHNGFYKAFNSLGYKTFWFKDEPLKNPDILKGSVVFCTLGQTDHLPITNEATYIIHTRWEKSYTASETKFYPLLKKNKAVILKCFTKNYLNPDSDWVKLAPYIYFNELQNSVAMPWATDLLPIEIDENFQELEKKKEKRAIFFGTIGKGGFGANHLELTRFMEEAQSKGYSIKTNDPWAKPMEPKEYETLTKESALAPAIQGKWQVEVGYIPCRIFKNISYGNLGITNSEAVYELFNNEIIFDTDEKKLCTKAIKALENFDREKQIKLMKFVRDHHTYVNRVKTLLSILELIKTK